MSSSVGSVPLSPPPPLVPLPLHNGLYEQILTSIPSNLPLLPSQLLVPIPTPTPPPLAPQPVHQAVFNTNITNITNGTNPSNNNNNNNGFGYSEEISTIFVVGFPEDMQEREFQNMFIFSPGFEAATLKVPTKDSEEDNTAVTTGSNNNSSNNNTSTNNKKQIIGFAKFRSRIEALEAKDTISGRKVDAEKGSVLKAEMAKKNLHTKRGLSSSDPFQLSQSSALLSQDQQQFHPSTSSSSSSSTSAPSMTVLAASTTSSSTFIQPLHPYYQHHPSSVPPSQHPDPTIASTKRSTGPHHSSVYEAFHSVPASDTPTLDNIYPDLFVPPPGNSTLRPINTGNSNVRLSGVFSPTHRFSFDSQSIDHHTNTKSFNGSYFNIGGTLLEKIDPSPASHPNHSVNDASSASPSTTLSSSLFIAQTSQKSNHHYSSQQHTSSSSPSSPPPPLFANDNAQSQVYRYMEEGNDDHRQEALGKSFNGLTINTATSATAMTAMTAMTATTTTTTTTATTATTATINTSLASTPTTIVSNGGLPSPGLLSPTGFRSLTSMMIMPSTNPADQNPPCNTLYVGNLPPNTDENELRQLFAKCVGYKRLSFRQKSNGPMCFVEFEDVYCATQALQDLYGNPLSNSIKGGIRLSFSKNPLGVRQNSISNGGCNNGNGLFQNTPYYRDSLSFDPPFSSP